MVIDISIPYRGEKLVLPMEIGIAVLVLFGLSSLITYKSCVVVERLVKKRKKLKI